MLSLGYWKEKEVEINEKKYSIDLSFDNVIRVFDLMKDEAFEEEERIHLAMKMFLDCDVLEKDEECNFEMLIEAFNYIK